MWMFWKKRKMESQYRSCLLFFDNMVSRSRGLGYEIGKESLDVSGESAAIEIITPYLYYGVPVRAVGTVDIKLLKRKAPQIVMQTEGGMRMAKGVLCDLFYDSAILHARADRMILPGSAGLVRSDGSNAYRENKNLVNTVAIRLADAQLIAAAYCGRLYLTMEDWQNTVTKY